MRMTLATLAFGGTLSLLAGSAIAARDMVPDRGGCRSVSVNGKQVVICPQRPGPMLLPNPPAPAPKPRGGST